MSIRLNGRMALVLTVQPTSSRTGAQGQLTSSAMKEERSRSETNGPAVLGSNILRSTVATVVEMPTATTYPVGMPHQTTLGVHAHLTRMGSALEVPSNPHLGQAMNLTVAPTSTTCHRTTAAYAAALPLLCHHRRHPLNMLAVKWARAHVQTDIPR